MSSNHTDTVMGIYAAFGRGDVASILDELSDDVRWDHGIRETDVAYLQPGTGKDHVARFFTDLAENLQFTTFEPNPPCSSDDTVIVAVREEATNLRTGATVGEDIYVHIWTLGRDGKVVSFRHVGDWARHEAAAHATPAPAASASGSVR
jgi:ketosteroid isomerase-like protein